MWRNMKALVKEHLSSENIINTPLDTYGRYDYDDDVAAYG